MKNKIIAVTMVRKNSVGVPGKNMIDVCGQPLLYWTISEVKKSKFIDRYLVYSDDPSIEKLCDYTNTEFLKEDEHKSDGSVLGRCLDCISDISNYRYIANIMATCPLRIVEDIDNCIQLLIENDYDSVVSVTQLEDHHPARIKYIENGKLKNFYPEPPNSRRQWLKPKAYIRAGGIYIFKTEYFLKNRLEYNEGVTIPYIIPPERAVNIDNPLDLELVRILKKI